MDIRRAGSIDGSDARARPCRCRSLPSVESPRRSWRRAWRSRPVVASRGRWIRAAGRRRRLLAASDDPDRHALRLPPDPCSLLVPAFEPDHVDANAFAATQKSGIDGAPERPKEASRMVSSNENPADVRLARELEHLADHVGRFEPDDFRAEVAGEDGVVDELANLHSCEAGAPGIEQDGIELAAIFQRRAMGLVQQICVAGAFGAQTSHHRSLRRFSRNLKWDLSVINSLEADHSQVRL